MLKKNSLLIAIIFLLTTIIPTKAENSIEEIKLNTQSEEEFKLQEAPHALSVEEETLKSEEPTLREKLQNVYNLEVEKYDKPTYLLEEILTKKFDENSPFEHTQLWFGYNGFLGGTFENDSATNHYDINAINIGYDIFLKEDVDARIMLNYNPFSNRNVVRNMFADVYIATNKIPHHRISVGNFRPPTGVEGCYSSFGHYLAKQSQISRTFGTVRKLGARVQGNFSLMDYDLGIYSPNTYFKQFFDGEEFIGWVNFKPLGRTDGRYGNLKIGTGIDAGHRHKDFVVTGAYIGYDYKRFMANIEWAHANGYNGLSGHMSENHANGFYSTLGYMLTNKLQVLTRYDQFDPNTDISNNSRREYTLGFNYFLKGQGLRLILNYIFCDNDNAKDSHRILLGTQILL